MKWFSLFFVVIFGVVMSSGKVDKQQEQPNSDGRVFHVDVGAQHFANEALPNTDDVKERLEYELIKIGYWHSEMLWILQNTTRYFPVVEKILREEGVPDDFKYLMVAESSFRNAKSPAGAVGMWQFRQGTAKDFGLKVTSEVDERYHLESATRAACKYLKKAYGKFGSWTNAAASYNMGMSRLSSIQVDQREESYYNLNINEETMRYVFRIVALKNIITNPQNFGFHLAEHDRLKPFDNVYNVKLEEPISNLGDYAHSVGLSYRELKRLNPWLRSNKLTSVTNIPFIKIPRK